MEAIHETRPNACTKCGHMLGPVIDLGNRRRRPPRPGAFAMCLECGWTMVFNDDMTLRDPTHSESNNIIGDPRFIRTQMARDRVKRRLEKWSKKHGRQSHQA